MQAQKFGAKLALPRRVVALECDERPYRLLLDDGTRVRTETVVIATGARYRSLDLENCRDYEGRGIHYAATELEATLCHDEDAIGPPPLLGEHNEEVLKELGYSDEEIAKLGDDKVIANAPAMAVPPAIVSMALKLPYQFYVPSGILQRVDEDYREQLGIA